MNLDVQVFDFAGANLSDMRFDGALVNGALFSDALVTIKQLSRAKGFDSVHIGSYGSIFAKL
jgi:hypothetical protein